MVIATAKVTTWKRDIGNLNINTSTQKAELHEISPYKERIVGNRIVFTIQTIKKAIETKQYI